MPRKINIVNLVEKPKADDGVVDFNEFARTKNEVENEVENNGNDINYNNKIVYDKMNEEMMKYKKDSGKENEILQIKRKKILKPIHIK